MTVRNASALALYESLVVWPAPARLSLVHDLDGSPLALGAALALQALLLGAAVAAARRYRVASFAVFWFLWHHGVEAAVVPARRSPPSTATISRSSAPRSGPAYALFAALRQSARARHRARGARGRGARRGDPRAQRAVAQRRARSGTTRSPRARAMPPRGSSAASCAKLPGGPTKRSPTSTRRCDSRPTPRARASGWPRASRVSAASARRCRTRARRSRSIPRAPRPTRRSAGPSPRSASSRRPPPRSRARSSSAASPGSSAVSATRSCVSAGSRSRSRTIARRSSATRATTTRARARARRSSSSRARARRSPYLETAVESQPNPRYLAHFADALWQLGDTGGALDAVAMAVRVDPSWPGATSRLAWMLALCPDPERRDPARALRIADAALEQAGAPDRDPARRARGRARRGGPLRRRARRRRARGRPRARRGRLRARRIDRGARRELCAPRARARSPAPVRGEPVVNRREAFSRDRGRPRTPPIARCAARRAAASRRGSPRCPRRPGRGPRSA